MKDNRLCNPHLVRRCRVRRCRVRCQRGGFTLVQILIVLAILSVLAAILMSSFSNARTAAALTQCDIRLKSIALGLDAYRQETGKYPADLNELRTQRYLQDPDALHCPADPRPNGSYTDFYVLRAPRDESDRASLVCPFHEKDNRGAQAYLGRYTTQFASRPAQLIGANSATVQHPGKAPVAAAAGMELHGGDLIETSPQGLATIEFADGSQVALQGGARVTVLQSFLDENASASLYTLVQQTLGSVTYRVRRGSKFDVGTPTATAGARGTEFQVEVNAVAEDGPTTRLLVIESKVAFTTLRKTVLIAPGPTWVTASSSGHIVDSFGNHVQ
ncbi:MAG TPA: FecR domain-containing protein [Abditibacteriaceae bacterium]|nr:FecR domain-containing protein [Abditibacteriaceae bacterium]